MAGTFPVETRGIGKPDYSKEISSGKERAGLSLSYTQTLSVIGIVFSSVYTGTHTAVVSATIMTDAAAHFTANVLVGLTIINVTDGSSGVIIANTETTVTVVALVGGLSNQWNPGDVYNIPSPFAWVQTPLAPGATAHYIDNSTGLSLPYTVPQGYTMSLIAAGGSATEDVRILLYFDGFLVVNIAIIAAGSTPYENRVVGISTATIDPTGAAPHTLDVQVTNLGGGNLEGGLDMTGILEAVGTSPLPTTKTVRCKWCGHQHTVPRETTFITCPKCGKLFIVADYSRFRGTP